MKKHANIPIFIPHLGCPNDCVFCNQRKISGKIDFDFNNVRLEIENALYSIEQAKNNKSNSLGYAESYTEPPEIAFFGGSFTGIDRNLMISLLELAQEYIRCGKVSSIRLSTRPDYINKEILDILSLYTVHEVELGLQSMDDEVLIACRRGHDSDCAREACQLVNEYGYSLVGQMMIGLPLSTLERELYTAKELCNMGVSAVRIYPTVVFYETQLCKMTLDGAYTPLELEDAVFRTAEVIDIFEQHNIPTIRVGLCSSENLSSEAEVLGGANHPAIGELAMNRVFLKRIFNILDKKQPLCNKVIKIFVPQGAKSKVIGQNKRNLTQIYEKYSPSGIIIIEKNELIGYNIEIDIM